MDSLASARKNRSTMMFIRDRDDVSSWDTAKPYRLAGRLSTCNSSHAPRRVHADPLGAMRRALVPLLPASLRRGVLILQLVRTNRMFLFMLTWPRATGPVCPFLLGVVLAILIQWQKICQWEWAFRILTNP